MTRQAKRRWFRFSPPQMLLLVVTVFAFWMGWNLYRARERARMIQAIQVAGGQVVTGKFTPPLPSTGRSLPFGWWLCGARHIDLVRLPHHFTYKEAGTSKMGAYHLHQHVAALFPEAHMEPQLSP